MFFNIKLIKKAIYYFLLIITFLCALFFRLKIFTMHIPFWVDECSLAFNVVCMPWQHLFHKLLYNQAAPLLFLVISKLFSYIIPDLEYSLRMFPFLCSIASLPVFYLLAKKFFKNEYYTLIAFAIFALNYTSLYYCKEFKQYSCELLLTTLILLSYFFIDIKKTSNAKLIKFGLLYAVCPWFSFTSIFSITAIFITLLIENKKEYKKVLLLFTPFALSFILFIIKNISLNSNKYLHSFWKKQNGFINKNFSNFFFIIDNLGNYYFNKLKNIYLFLFMTGIIFSISKLKDSKYLILNLIFLFILTASYFELYPFAARMTIYFFPIFTLYCVISLVSFKEWIMQYLHIDKKVVLLIFYCLLSLIIYTQSDLYITTLVNKNYKIEDEEVLLKKAYMMMSPEDTLYIAEETMFKVYSYKLKYKFKNVIYEKYKSNDGVLENLNNLESGKTYYYISAHHYSKFPDRIPFVWNWAKTQNNPFIFFTETNNVLIKFTKK